MAVDQHRHGNNGLVDQSSPRLPGISVKLEVGVSLTPSSRREYTVEYASRSDTVLGGRLVPAFLVPKHLRSEQSGPVRETQHSKVRLRRIRTRSALQLGRLPMQPHMDDVNTQATSIEGLSHHITEYYAPLPYYRRGYPHPERGYVHVAPPPNEEIPINEYFSPTGMVHVPQANLERNESRRDHSLTHTPSPRTYAALGFHPMSPDTIPRTSLPGSYPWSPDSIGRTPPSSTYSKSSYAGSVVSPDSSPLLNHQSSRPLRRAFTVDRKALPPLPSRSDPSHYRLGVSDMPWSSPTWIDTEEPRYGEPLYAEPLYTEPMSATYDPSESSRREDPQRTSDMIAFQQAMMSIDALDNDGWEGHQNFDSMGELAQLPRGPRGVGWAVRIEPSEDQRQDETRVSQRASDLPLSPPPPYEYERSRYLHPADHHWVWDEGTTAYFLRPNVRRRVSTG